MRIFYFRKKNMKWIIGVIITITLIAVIWAILGADSRQSENALMITNIISMASQSSS